MCTACTTITFDICTGRGGSPARRARNGRAQIRRNRNSATSIAAPGVRSFTAYPYGGYGPPAARRTEWTVTEINPAGGSG
ncbi:hypothetical protein GCM10010140_73900 [Streptosporangium pseudovulgare]|uniref:Uncharacterized protein n=1 Tax=Streptosporangium pseudovulgare TaxID=35765 RepID=A0ABQ2RHU1_9ACTN|nr:hypothetical protein GCM10010140_73900 [Streptosporangium pseudovulgare]